MCADSSTGNTPNTPQFTKDGFKDSLISWMLAPLVCFLCVKNNNKNHWLDKLSQSFSDISYNSFTWQKIK